MMNLLIGIFFGSAIAWYVSEAGKRKNLRKEILRFMRETKRVHTMSEISLGVANKRTNALWKVQQLPQGYDLSTYEPDTDRLTSVLADMVARRELIMEHPWHYSLHAAA
jgi:hypothetical protein